MNLDLIVHQSKNLGTLDVEINFVMLALSFLFRAVKTLCKQYNINAYRDQKTFILM